MSPLERYQKGWNEALDHAADSFASQAGQMQMCVEQRLLITVAQRIRAMKASLPAAHRVAEVRPLRGVFPLVKPMAARLEILQIVEALLQDVAEDPTRLSKALEEAERQIDAAFEKNDAGLRK
jgi:hypothetical protein